MSPKSTDQNAKQFHKDLNGHAGNSHPSSWNELFSHTQTPDSKLLSPQLENQPNIEPGSRQGAESSPEQTSFWGQLRLRTKVMLAAIVLGTLPVVAVGTIAYQIADKQLVQEIQRDKINAADGLDDEVSRFIAERYGNIQVLAALPILRNPQVREIVPLQQKEAVLDNFLKVYGMYDSIAAFDLDGNVIVQSQGQPLSNHKDRAYFQQVLKTDRPVISDPELSKTTGEPAIQFAAPVKDVVTGKTIAVVRARMPVKNLDKVLQNYGKGSDEFILVGPDGKIFAAKQKDDVGKDAASLFASYPKLAAARKPSVQLETDLLDNAEHLFAYSPFEQVEGLPNLNWSSIITQPSDDAYAPQYLLLWSLGIGTAVTALLVSALAAYFANRATRPIVTAADAVEKLGQGELDTRIAVAGKDELAKLGSNINHMAEQLQGLLREQEIENNRTQLLGVVAGSNVSAAEDLEDVFNAALVGARQSLNCDRVVIYRFHPDWSGYISAESVASGWPVALNDKIEDACISQYLIEAYKKGRVVPTNDVRMAGFHPEHMKLLERLQVKANLVTPIVNNDQLFGLLIAHHCASPHEWQPSEINFLKELSNRLGVILDRISFLEQKEAEAKRSQVLKDITVRIGQSLDPAEIFNKAVQEVRQALKSDRVVVYSFNDKWQGTVIAESVADGWTKALGAKIDDPCFANRYVERYRQGRVQATENIFQAGLTDCHLKQLATFEVKANLVAPILQGGNLLGLLIAHQCSAPRVWEQGDIDLFAQLATQIGFALDRANLLNQQKSAREFLQKRALELLMEVDPISRGDLTIRAKVTEDEIGTIADSYNATINSLRKIVTQVQTAAQQVASTTSSSEGSVQELSKEALRQSEEIGVALERIQEMTNSIRAVATSAEQAEAAVKQATQTVAAGDAAMNRTVDGMMAIRQTVAETSKKVKRLGESSQKISKVVNLISTFADQTNLLALNASIEAAHAGEQGRGFAVVADEVRTLARQSAEATAEIESLVKDIQSETNEVVAAMEAGTEQVVTGTELVNETRQNLLKITEVSQQISELVAAIAQSAAAQSQVSQVVSVKMSDVATIANQTSSEATVVSSAFKQLLNLAEELQATASQFKVN